MDVVSLALAKGHTNEKLNSLPSNRPTKTVSFDGGIYSVGNDVVNGQVSDVVLKGNTWTNKAGAGDTSPQTVSNLDATKTYLLINDAGANITIDTVDTPTPVKLTGATEFGFEWASGKMALYELSMAEADLDAAVLGQKYHYVSNTKSTDSVRVKSVGKNLLKKLESLSDFISPIQSNINVFFETDKLVITTPSTFRVLYTNPIRVKPNTSYRFSIDGYASAGYRRVEICDSLIETTVLSYASLFEERGIRRGVFNSGSNEQVYIRFYITGSVTPGDMHIYSIQLEEGSTYTEYEPYKESIVNVNLPEPLRSLPNGVKDEISVSDGKLIKKIGSKVNVASGTVINYADMVTSGQFVAYYADGTQQVGLKGDTLTADAVTLTYQLATPIVTKLPAQAPLQVFENGTVYVEPIGDPAESTVPSVEMTIPTGNSNKFGVASHDYDGSAADWVLTNSESKCFLLAVSSAGGAANIIAPNRPGTMYAISNASGYTITIKISGGTGVAITNAKTVLVIHNGADYTALTAEL